MYTYSSKVTTALQCQLERGWVLKGLQKARTESMFLMWVDIWFQIFGTQTEKACFLNWVPIYNCFSCRGTELNALNEWVQNASVTDCEQYLDFHGACANCDVAGIRKPCHWRHILVLIVHLQQLGNRSVRCIPQIQARPETHGKQVTRRPIQQI